MDWGLAIRKRLWEFCLPLPLMNSLCSSDRFYCEFGLLFLAESLRVLLEAQLVLLGIWVAELMSFICTLAWDVM